MYCTVLYAQRAVSNGNGDRELTEPWEVLTRSGLRSLWRGTRRTGPDPDTRLVGYSRVLLYNYRIVVPPPLCSAGHSGSTKTLIKPTLAIASGLGNWACSSTQISLHRLGLSVARGPEDTRILHVSYH